MPEWHFHAWNVFFKGFPNVAEEIILFSVAWWRTHRKPSEFELSGNFDVSFHLNLFLWVNWNSHCRKLWKESLKKKIELKNMGEKSSVDYTCPTTSRNWNVICWPFETSGHKKIHVGLRICEEKFCIFDVEMRTKVEKLDPTKHKVYKEENTCLQKVLVAVKCCSWEDLFPNEKHWDCHG